MLVRGDETGEVRLNDYEHDGFRVGAFLPGRVLVVMDQPRQVEPERSFWCFEPADADVAFADYLSMAHSEGWRRP